MGEMPLTDDPLSYGVKLPVDAEKTACAQRGGGGGGGGDGGDGREREREMFGLH